MVSMATEGTVIFHSVFLFMNIISVCLFHVNKIMFDIHILWELIRETNGFVSLSLKSHQHC